MIWVGLALAIAGGLTFVLAFPHHHTAMGVGIVLFIAGALAVWGGKGRKG